MKRKRYRGIGDSFRGVNTGGRFVNDGERLVRQLRSILRLHPIFKLNVRIVPRNPFAIFFRWDFSQFFGSTAPPDRHTALFPLPAANTKGKHHPRTSTPSVFRSPKSHILEHKQTALSRERRFNFSIFQLKSLCWYS